jgi:hypothetical protein
VSRAWVFVVGLRAAVESSWQYMMSTSFVRAIKHCQWRAIQRCDTRFRIYAAPTACAVVAAVGGVAAPTAVGGV